MITKKDEVMETNRWLEGKFSEFLVQRLTLKLNISVNQDRDQAEMCYEKPLSVVQGKVVSTQKISRAEQIKLWEEALAEVDKVIEKIKGLFEDETE